MRISDWSSDVCSSDLVIAEGTADLVGMTRAHIADAAIVRKTREGREAEIRPCIGCNQGCVGMLLGPERRMGCTVNHYIGREGEEIGRAPCRERVCQYV